MADEGEFPKIDGDTLYGSEVNSFREKVIGFVDQQVTCGSRTLAFIGGSVHYSGTFPSLVSDHWNISTSFYTIQLGANLQASLRLRFSGTEFNEVTTTKTNQLTGEVSNYPTIPLNHIITSGTFHSWGGTFDNPFDIMVEAAINNTGGAGYIGNLVVTGV